jgi:predicted glycosyltransferase
MRYQLFVNTPAHAHLYKHLSRKLQDRGHEVLVMGRDYGCTEPLLDYHDLPYEIYGRCDTSKFSLLRELPRHFLSIARHTRRFDPDVVFGVGAYAAFAGALSGSPVVVVADSEPTSLDHHLSKPVTSAFLTPAAFGKDLGPKHYRFDGFKESAYLHPDVFEPRDDIRGELGVGPDEKFAILRLNAFGSHHDVGHAGFTPERRRELIEKLSEHVTVFVSDEKGDMAFDDVDAREFDLHPALLHDALAEAQLLVADTQTMVTEAALLGTPAVRSNSFVGADDMGNFVELENHGLIYSLREFDDATERALELATDDDAKARWRRKRDEYVADKVNLTEVLVDVATRVDDLRGVATIERTDGTGTGV